MEITLYRTKKTKHYTEGRLVLEGKYLCDTLEPAWRDCGFGRPGKKVKGKTAIPAGRYALVVTYSPKFQRWLPLLLHVPLFTGIRIHAGNSVDDTAGCILVGKRIHEGVLIDSLFWLRKLMYELDHRPAGVPVWITVRDE